MSIQYWAKRACLFAIITVAMHLNAIAATNNSTLDAIRSLHWQQGPTTGDLAGKATIAVPDGYLFLNDKDTKKFLEYIKELPMDGTYLLIPRNGKWSAYFHFDATGYVKDNETINADDVMNSIKKATDYANNIKRKKGYPTVSVIGWRYKPKYNQNTKRLEWSILGKLDTTNEQVVNYETRILGRKGVMKIKLVASPDDIDGAVIELKNLLQGFQYDPGQRYSDFRQGDKVASYGLAALILGGAAAVATKKGFWAVIVGFFAAAWKLIAAAAAAALAWFRSLFKKKK